MVVLFIIFPTDVPADVDVDVRGIILLVLLVLSHSDEN